MGLDRNGSISVQRSLNDQYWYHLCSMGDRPRTSTKYGLLVHIFFFSDHIIITNSTPQKDSREIRMNTPNYWWENELKLKPFYELTTIAIFITCVTIFPTRTLRPNSGSMINQCNCSIPLLIVDISLLIKSSSRPVSPPASSETFWEWNGDTKMKKEDSNWQTMYNNVCRQDEEKKTRRKLEEK